MTLADYLRKNNILVPPTEAFAGLVTEGVGEPDEISSPFYLFYIDSDTDLVYYNNARTDADWLPVVPAE